MSSKRRRTTRSATAAAAAAAAAEAKQEQATCLHCMRDMNALAILSCGQDDMHATCLDCLAKQVTRIVTNGAFINTVKRAAASSSSSSTTSLQFGCPFCVLNVPAPLDGLLTDRHLKDAARASADTDRALSVCFDLIFQISRFNAIHYEQSKATLPTAAATTVATTTVAAVPDGAHLLAAWSQLVINKTPCCGAAYEHTDGCYRMQCRMAGCSKFWCGWCTQVFDSSAEAYGHVAQCTEQLTPSYGALNPSYGPIGSKHRALMRVMLKVHADFETHRELITRSSFGFKLEVKEWVRRNLGQPLMDYHQTFLDMKYADTPIFRIVSLVEQQLQQSDSKVLIPACITASCSTQNNTMLIFSMRLWYECRTCNILSCRICHTHIATVTATTTVAEKKEAYLAHATHAHSDLFSAEQAHLLWETVRDNKIMATALGLNTERHVELDTAFVPVLRAELDKRMFTPRGRFILQIYLKAMHLPLSIAATQAFQGRGLVPDWFRLLVE